MHFRHQRVVQHEKRLLERVDEDRLEDLFMRVDVGFAHAIDHDVILVEGHFEGCEEAGRHGGRKREGLPAGVAWEGLGRG